MDFRLFSYHQWDNMRIALNIDVAFLLSQLVFFIGLPTSDNLVSKGVHLYKDCTNHLSLTTHSLYILSRLTISLNIKDNAFEDTKN